MENPPLTKQNPKIEILNIKRLEDTGSLRALIDFRLNKSEFYSWRVIQQAGQEAWVSAPQDTWVEEGKKYYKPLIKFSKELMLMVSSALLKAFGDGEIGDDVGDEGK